MILGWVLSMMKCFNNGVFLFFSLHISVFMCTEATKEEDGDNDNMDGLLTDDDDDGGLTRKWELTLRMEMNLTALRFKS